MNVTNFEITQASIELFGALFCVMTGLLILVSGLNKKTRFMMLMYIVNAITLLSDACAYIFRGNVGKKFFILTKVSNFMAFAGGAILVLLFAHFMYARISEGGIIPNKIYKRLVEGGVIISLLLLIVNIFTGCMYYFDEKNYYHRNIGSYVFTFILMACVIVIFVMAIRYKRYTSAIYFWTAIAYALLPVVAMLLQSLFYGISFTYMGVTLCLTFMLIIHLRMQSSVKKKYIESNEKERTMMVSVFMFLVMVISMSVSIIACVISIQRIAADNSKQESEKIAHLVSKGVENEFIKPITVSATISKDYTLRKMFAEAKETIPEEIEIGMSEYLASIRDGFDYQAVFAVCDSTKAYYTYDGISRYLDEENESHDIWYTDFKSSGKAYELNVDTDLDVDNDNNLAIFMNTAILDDNGNFIGACGVGIEMNLLIELIRDYEKKYNVKIDLINENGLIMVDSDYSKIENESLESTYLNEVPKDGSIFYQNLDISSRMTVYLDILGWYLIVEDLDPDKISIESVITPCIIIFILGLLVVAVTLWYISVKEQKALTELIEHRRISLTDGLTGMLNRRAYDEECKSLDEKDSRSNLAVIMLDVNGLKFVNDNLGHGAGDELIIGAGKCMREAFDIYGNVYRTGGDEFMALLNCTQEQLDGCMNHFDKICSEWSGEIVKEVAVSKGAATAAEYPDASVEELEKIADKLMYEDKAAYYKRTGKERRKG